MSIIDRYILLEWLKAFFIIFLLTLGVVVIIDMQDNLPDFIEYEATGQIFDYYYYLIPSFLPLIVPVSLLISLLFALGNLHRHNEVIAMRAAGLSLFRITRSLWLVGILMSVILLYLNAQIIPPYVEYSRKMVENMRFEAEEKKHAAEQVGLILNPTFHNHEDGRLWVMNRYSQRTNQGFGLCVYELDEQGREKTRIMAREGIYFPEDGYWVLKDGRESKFKPETGDAYYSMAFDKKHFKRLTDTPDLMKLMNKEPKDLSLIELRELINKVPPENNPHIVPYAVKHHSMLANPFACLVIVGIAIPFAVSGVRSNPAVRVSKSIGLFAAYYIISNFCYLLGGEGKIDFVLSAWLPIILMIGVAVYLFRKAV